MIHHAQTNERGPQKAAVILSMHTTKVSEVKYPAIC